MALSSVLRVRSRPAQLLPPSAHTLRSPRAPSRGSAKRAHGSAKATGEQESAVPVVFLPGLKGTHLRHVEDARRRWLTLSGLFDFPSSSSASAARDLALPLEHAPGAESEARGGLEADGIVEYCVDIPALAVRAVPFYGEAVQSLRESGRPVGFFAYDWRRGLRELTEELEAFCDAQFGAGTPVQVVAHSMGGLIAFASMRRRPQRYAPGGVLVGVPFGTGVQYLEDMHLGYFTELGRCQQFLPEAQATFSSHWLFFPQRTAAHDVVDVSHAPHVPFQPGASALARQAADGELNAGPAPEEAGPALELDLYDCAAWEAHGLGVFDPRWGLPEERLRPLRAHMARAMQQAKAFREQYLTNMSAAQAEALPPLVVCASDTIPTVNQVLWRSTEDGGKEWDFANGRSVAGDGRIDFDKAFPPPAVRCDRVRLSAKHAKQMVGADWQAIFERVQQQAHQYATRP